MDDGRGDISTRLPLGRLGLHAAAFFLCSIWGTLAGQFIPLIANIRFDAAPWQSLVLTASIPTFLMASIFWDQLFRRLNVGPYAFVHWLMTCVPLGLMGLTPNLGGLIALHFVAAIGAAGWTPLAGALLKAFYTDRIRGRAYSLVTIAGFASGALSIVWGSRLQNHDPEAFRWFLPLMTVVQGSGLVLLTLAARGMLPPPRPAAPFRLRAVLDPVFHMGALLKGDRLFARYEAAFMTYGFGFMFCEALFPVYVTDVLGLDYRQVTDSAFVVQRLVMILAIVPAGLLMDRLGPARTSSVAFLVLSAYPLGLLAASLIDGPQFGLAVANVFFGLAMAGVQHGWMLGPVALAPTPERVSSYVAVHTTLVGFRGMMAQGLGVALYEIFGGFTVPFVGASVMLWWATAQMWALRDPIERRLHELRRPPGPETAPMFEPAVAGTPVASGGK